MPGLYESDMVLKIPEYLKSITNIQSKAAPFMKLCPRAPKVPENMLTDWGVENYARRGYAGVVDGTDKTTFSSISPTKVEGYGMWQLSDGWMVAKLATLTKTVGASPKQQKPAQIAKDASAFFLQINRQILSDQDMAAESKPDQAYQSRGAFSWMAVAAQGVKPVAAAFRPPTAAVYTSTLALYTADALKLQLAAAYDSKHGPVDLTHFLGISLKGQMSTWTQKVAVSSEAALQVFNQDAKSKKMINTVDVFEFDAGIIRNVLTSDLLCSADGATSDYTNNSGLGLDLSMWELAWLEEITPFEEGEKSGGPRGYHSAVYILKCKNALGQIAEKIEE